MKLIVGGTQYTNLYFYEIENQDLLSFITKILFIPGTAINQVFRFLNFHIVRNLFKFKTLETILISIFSIKNYLAPLILHFIPN